ncbi:MAG TPA: hypothetical protein PKC45_09910 [Gemmatales bacterium]|nr:hypothetical protein [Gemmatales bacterium]
MESRRRLAELAFFCLLLAGMLVATRAQLFYDPGTFWHTVVGEKLLTTHPFLDTDPLTFSQQGRPWIPSQWLAEIGMALAHRALGLDGLLWATLLLLAGLLAWLGGRLVAAGCHPILGGFITVLIFSAMCYHFHARPHLLTMLFLALLLAVLVEVEAGRWRLASLWGLVPLFLVWVNVHGGVVGGMATFGLVGIGWGLSWLLAGKGPLKSGRDVALLAGVGAVSAATALINPYGWRLPATWLELLRLDLPQVISEHAPLDLTQPEGVAVVVFGGLYLPLLLGVLPGRPRVTWLVPLVWLVLACLRIRNGPLFAVTAGVVLADLLPYTRWMQALARRGDLFTLPPESQPETEKPGSSWLASLVRTLGRHIWLVLLPLPLLLPQSWMRGWVHLNPEHWPIEIVDVIRREAGQPGTRIFCDDPCGGFLTYHVPGLLIFFDDRCELHGLFPPERPLLFDYVDGMKTPATAEATFDRWDAEFGFNLALIHSDNAYGRLLRERPDWQVLAETQAEDPKKRIILARRSAAR